MRRKEAFTVFLVLAALYAGAAGAADVLTWSTLPELPPAPGQDAQPGVAGAFVGVHNGALIVAGGANFPDGPPWHGGQRVLHDDVFVLEQTEEGPQWRTGFTLPRPLGYGVAVETSEGVLCIGGCDVEQAYRDVFLLKWDAAAGHISIETLPPLPRPLAFAAGARVGGAVYVAGGQETMKDAAATRNFFAFDLARKEWRELDPWPGPARVVPVAAAQSDGDTDCFFLFSGRTVAPGEATRVLADAYRYNPNLDAWTRLADIVPAGQDAPTPVQAGTAIRSGAHHIFVFGGDDGKLYDELDDRGRRIASLPDGPEKDALKEQQADRLDNHPGFPRTVLAYNTVTDTWMKQGELPGGSQVTTSAVRWGGGIVIPSGEIRPGVRTPDVRFAEGWIESRFGAVNYTVLGGYLLVLVCMGFYFSRRENTTDDFFKAGGRIPWWAAGLSIFGTQLSAITFIAIPAKTFATDWRYFMANMTIVMAAPIIVLLFLPFYRRLNVTTAYEYLEKRFNPASRLLGSLMFILLQFGRIGIVLFIPSMVLSVVTGMDVRLCILLMGVLSILYTVLGGIEAVIWTDVIQVAVLMGGALLAVGIMLADLGGGLPGAIRSAWDAGKLHTFDFRFDFTTPTFWTVVLGGMAAQMISYGSDQAVIQRYLTTSDEKQAARGIWANAILCIPASVLFFFVGTALFLFYQAHPAAINPTLQPADAIFPWFIVSQLPAGIAGLVIAGVFAASMSSLDSSMNSVAAAVTTDWAPRFKTGMNDRSAMAIARWTTVAIGLAGTGFALMMVSWDVKSIWDQFSQIIGLFAGGLAGLFLLGMLTRRANGAGAVSGLLAGGLIQYVVKAHTDVHLLLYSLTGLVSCFGVGYVVSLFTGGPKRNLEGLTVYPRTRQGARQ